MPQDDRGSDVVEEDTKKCCAWVTKSVSIDVKPQSWIPNNPIGKYYDQSGLNYIISHEAKRRSIYKMGYNAYLKPIQTEEGGTYPTQCGTVCRSTPGAAKVLLESYLVDLRATAKKQYFNYWLGEQKALNSTENGGNIFDGIELMGTSSPYTPNPPPPFVVPPPSCP
jgi:hypothetical protein